MNPISNTAFYCCGIRMQDAESAQPICGDIYARKFMNETGMQIYETFKGEIRPNATNVARHRIIDDLLRQQLAENPDLQIIIIGAGFDSRAYRLDGGNWIELDEPQVITHKNERLPVTVCKNRLQRIAIDFTNESLADKLAPFAGDRPTTFVIEGVFMYLDVETINSLLQTLRRLFSRQILICDLMSEKFFEKYSRPLHERIANLGTSFTLMDKPEQIFLNNGYQISDKTSPVRMAVETGTIKIPGLIFRLFMKTAANGYCVFVFES